MTEINIDPSRLDGARLLSNRYSDIQVFAITPTTFALYERSENKIIFAFASSGLAKCLAEMDYPEIHGAYLIRTEAIASSMPWPEKTLYLNLMEGTTSIVLDHFDHVYIQKAHKSKIRKNQYLVSPHKMFGCTPFLHFDCMLLTSRLINVIEEISDEGQQIQLVHMLWKDYQLVLKNSPSERVINVSGEFLEFSVTRFRQYLFVFDLLIPTDDEEVVL